MGAYLFSGLVTQVLPEEEAIRRQLFNPVVRGCCEGIVVGDSVEEAEGKLVNIWMKSNQADPPIPTEVGKIIYAPLVDALITEAGFETIDWPKLNAQIQELIITDPEEEFERGHWVPVNDIVRPEGLSADIEALQETLPEEISSGLNWDVNKQFYFLVRALSPAPPFPENPPEEIELPESNEDDGGEPPEDDTSYFMFDREDGSRASIQSDVAALIKARNAVVGAWLWRRYAADTPQAANEMRLEAGFGAMDIPAME